MAVTLLLLLFVNVVVLDYLAIRSGGGGGGGGGGRLAGTPPTLAPPDAQVRWTPFPSDPAGRGAGAALNDTELAYRRRCEGLRVQLPPRDFLLTCACPTATCGDVGVLTQQTMAFCVLGQLYASAAAAASPSSNNTTSTSNSTPCTNVQVGTMPVLDKMGWLAGPSGGRDPCTWGGVTCDAGAGLPTALVLDGLTAPGLGTALPSDLGSLPTLTRLSLVGAGLRGLVPRSVCARAFTQGCTLTANPGLDTLAICASCSV
jgi:hypothetical protein